VQGESTKWLHPVITDWPFPWSYQEAYGWEAAKRPSAPWCAPDETGLEPLMSVPLATALAPAWIAWDPLFPYFTGSVLLVLGLVLALRKDVPAGGVDTLIALGPVFVAVPIAVFGSDHFIFAGSVARLVPSWIPGHLFWVYFVGTCLIAAGASLVLGKLAGLAAGLFGVMLLLFEALIHIPQIVRAPTNRFLWAVALRDLAFSGGALAFAATHAAPWRAPGSRKLVTLGRLFLGIPSVFFGIEHLLHPDFRPGVPLPGVTPPWIPGRVFWGYLTGAVFLVAGSALVLNRKARWAAAGLGLMILLLVFVVYAPIVIANPTDIGDALNPLVDTLLLSGSALCLAGSEPRTK
jgi:uncharacterized membrane protein